ncbi:hypothetical protein DIPPA_04350 [Diplonema papillatum]|nr:hypothetical protein DIPPA_04350 [Diplonema papillatum]
MPPFRAMWLLKLLALSGTLRAAGAVQTPTLTLPTATSTESLTVPTTTVTSTATASSTLSATDTLSGSLSLSLTATATHLYFDNYTAIISPAVFTQGQELRVQITTVVDSNAINAFNVTTSRTLETRVFVFEPAKHTDCDKYVDSSTEVYSTSEFGLSDADNAKSLPYTAFAHVTFSSPAANTDFLICFKHTLEDDFVRPAVRGSWQLLGVEQGDGSVQTVFRSLPSKVWYHLPEATAGQYSIIQVLSSEPSLALTYPASACGASSSYDGLAPCGHGDNLKLVPKGTPCTYEHQSFKATYHGSNEVTADGVWQPAAYVGLLEGATAGGVGRFGTQYSNPLVDEWTEPGSYGDANEGARQASTEYSLSDHPSRHAYVYVRLPMEVDTDFEVCYSSREERAAIINATAATNSSVDSAPMWRKLYRCTDPTDCESSGTFPQFTVLPERVGWTMFDVSPGTWGTIRFDDSAAGGLSAAPARATTVRSTEWTPSPLAFPVPPTPTVNYWAGAAGGGDLFKLVPASFFDEARTLRDAPLAPAGSFAKSGCWDRTLDTPRAAAPDGHAVDGQGGYSENGAAMPIGSADLTADPSDPLGASSDDADGLPATYSTVWVPKKGSRWYVCYRKAATPHAGFRLAPWHWGGSGDVPAKWRHLEEVYTPPPSAMSPAGAPTQLVPYEYGADVAWSPGKGIPPEVTWYMNDTREATWGPVSVEMTNASNPERLDRRGWNYRRTYASGDSLAATEGSALRLVRSDLPCDWLVFFNGIDASMGAESADGGGTECGDQRAFTESPACDGSSSNLTNVLSVAFYLKVPLAHAPGHRVCFRHGGWNWRQLSPSQSYYRRSDWSPEQHATYLQVQTNPLVSNLAVRYSEERSGMEALFLISSVSWDITTGPRSEDGTGDVLRLVPSSDQCDITPAKWPAQADLADTYLSLYCDVPGTGSLSTSGLADASAPCGFQSAATDTFCSGQSCPVATDSETAQLLAMVRVSPPVYDDIVPFDSPYSNSRAAAGAITLPSYEVGGENQYKLCYKATWTANWVMFNETFEVFPPRSMALSYPDAGSALVSGELQEFELQFADAVASSGDKAVVPDGVAAVHAKLVARSALANDNCFAPAASTEASAMVSATDRYRVGKTTYHLAFRLVVPHSTGAHWLCVRVVRAGEDALHWWRVPAPFTVVDNGIRWFVTPGYEPINQGESLVRFTACTADPAADPGCGAARREIVFDTSAGSDAAKIVVPSHACHAGALAHDEVADHGDSWHVSKEGVLHGLAAAGVEDLGPADGPSDTAETIMTSPLPPDGSDVRTEYKVCFKTSFANPDGTSRAAWVEVRQARGLSNQVVVLDDAGTRSQFLTRAGVLKEWFLAAPLQPNKVLISRDVLRGDHAEAVALAGASTLYVGDSDTSAPLTTDAEGGWGFNVTTHAGAAVGGVGSGNWFKLVLAGTAATRYPPLANNGTGWEWTDIETASCSESQAVDSTSTAVACTVGGASGPGACPGLRSVGNGVKVTFQIPIDPGKYIVCYRVSASLPWLWLQNGGSGAQYLYTQPSYLEFSASDRTNLTAYDLRMATSVDGLSAVALSSWCSVNQVSGTGIPCRAQNGAVTSNVVTGFYTDLVSIVTDVNVCTRPQVSSRYGDPPTGWFYLIRVSNSSSRIWDTWATRGGIVFTLPPVVTSPTGRYKICLYKAGTPRFGAPGNGIPASSWVSKGGVVYQLFDRELNVGYYTDNVQVSKLEITPLLDFNESVRFIEYDSSSTKSIYQQVPEEAITEPTSGLLSYTPVVRSGTTLSVVVQASSVYGVLPYGSYAVWVEKCPSPGSWDALRCSEPVDGEQSDEFLVRNVRGVCATERSASYGWGVDGLKQFFAAGSVTFRLQFRSACNKDLSNNDFGCGLRFAAQPTGTLGPIIYSNPLWINVENHWPDALRLDGVSVNSAIEPADPQETSGCSETSALCFMKRCHHGALCSLRIQARHGGPEEFAANGSVSVVYSDLDYGAWQGVPTDLAASFVSDSWAVVKGQKWQQGGYLDFANVPLLSPGVEEAVAFFNVTFALDDFQLPATASSWTRVAILVARQVPAAIRVTHVVPMDIHGLKGPGTGAVPTQAWSFESLPADPETTDEGAFPRPRSVAVAMEGSYLEALVPYELQYEICAAETDPCASVLTPDVPLSGWSVAGSVKSQSLNFVLQTCHELAADGTPTFCADNLRTSPAYTTDLFQDVMPSNMGSGNSYRLWFRIMNNVGCSRFTVPAGCLIEFTFKKGTVSVTMAIRTPVRVVAQSLKIATASSAASVDAVSVSAVTNGIMVTAYPGTPMGSRWLVDEFHYGDIFALISSPSPTDGARNRDGVSLLDSPPSALVGASACRVYSDADPPACLVRGYTPARLLGSWGARFLLRTSAPCHRCEFTFHSTWGAGPESFTDERHGFRVLSLTDDTDALACTPGNTTVAMPEASTVSTRFSVSVEPRNRAGDNVPWPRGWVFLDLSSGVTTATGQRLSNPVLRRADSAATLQSVRMGAANGTTAAVFDNLYFSGAAPAANRTDVFLRFYAAADVYDADEPGSVVAGSVTRACTAQVTLVRPAAAAATRYLRVTSVSGATALCDSAAGCRQWYATTAANEMTVSVAVYQRPFGSSTDVVDTTDRNITAMVPAGQATAAWQCRSQSAPCTTEAMKLRSPMEDAVRYTGRADGPGAATQAYSFGAPSVALSRSQNSNGVSAAFGRGSISIVQQALADLRQPVRGATMSVCATAAWDSSIVDTAAAAWLDGNPCVDIELWIVPPASASYKTAIFQATAPTAPAPGTSTCGIGATPFSLTVISYYTPPSGTGRYIVYNKPLEFTLTSPAVDGQLANTLADVNSAGVTSSTLVAVNGVPSQASVRDMLVTAYDMMATFRFYALHEQSLPTRFQISAANLALPTDTIASVSSAQSYAFTRPALKPFTVWEVLDTVAHDDECPGKRLLSTTTSHYRTYAGPPGVGWSYASTGAAAGVPFPVQTIVRSATVDGEPVAPAVRAWTFASSLVTVKKRQWSGCSDGGDLLVSRLRPSRTSDTVLLLPSTFTTAFTAPTIPDMIPTSQGVATAWVTLTEPCEHCVLELNLCYTSATDVASCFADQAGDTNGYPAFAERTKVTKQFSVEKQKADGLHIVADVPAGEKVGPDTVVSVGDPFTTTFEAVQRFAGWSIPVAKQGNYTVWVAARWSHASAESPYTARAMQYGDGGFLSAGLRSEGACRVSPGDFVESVPYSAKSPLGAAKLSYFFTRPCSQCEVWFYYELPRADGTVATGVFPQRTYTLTDGRWAVGGTTAYKVRTCGLDWALAGVPPVSVRRRREFSLTAWRVDENNLPAWDGDGATLVKENSLGNGAGGYTVVTSPLLGAAGQVAAVNGTATARLLCTRAAYQGAVQFAGHAHSFTVLTDPTRMVAIPSFNRSVPQFASPSKSLSTWAFHLYAADALGDRSFTAGGPTPLQWRPPYSDGYVPPAKLGVAVKPRVDYSRVTRVVAAGAAAPLALSAALPAAALLGGAVLYNGAPHSPTVTDGIGGLAVLELTGSPAGLLDVVFTVDGVELPVWTEGGDNTAPLVRWTVEPERFALDVGEVVVLQEGEILDVTAYAVGTRPLTWDANGTSVAYFHSTADIMEPAVFAVDCSSCATCAVNTPSGNNTAELSSPFTLGMAVFSVAVYGVAASSSCSVAVRCTSPHFESADAQTFSLRVAPTAHRKWTWKATSTFAPAAGAAATDPVAEAEAVVNRTTTLALQAWDADFSAFSADLDAPAASGGSALRLVGSPAGCFVCEDGCVPVANGSAVSVRGVFVAADGASLASVGSCVIAEVSNLPNDTVLAQSLSVTVRLTEKLGLAGFEGLSAYVTPASSLSSSARQKAMVVGQPAVLVLTVTDSNGDVARGDHATEVTLTGTREAANVTRTVTWSATARSGLASFVLDVDTTRSLSCPPGAAACEHHPWTFTAAARLNQHLPQRYQYYRTLSGIGPLYAVTQITRLEVDLQPAAGVWLPLVPGRPPVPWVWGYPFSLRISAVGGSAAGGCGSLPERAACEARGGCRWAAGNCTGVAGARQALHAAEGGSSRVWFMPWATPCPEVDNGTWLAGTCLDQGKGQCSDGELPVCGGYGWVIAGSESVDGHEQLLTEGSAVVEAAVFVAELDADRQKLTSEPAALFQLTLTEPLEPDGRGVSFVGAVRFQKIERLRFEGQNVTCRAVASPVNNATGQYCTLPRETFPLVSRDAASSIFYYPRAPSEAAFDLSVRIEDRFGDVMAGDNVSTLILDVTCHNSDLAPYFKAGVVGGVQGNVIITPEGWNAQTAVNGVVTFAQVGFGGLCRDASMTLTCSNSLLVDAHGACSGKFMASELFEVGDTSIGSQTPATTSAPPDSTGLPRIVLELGAVDLARFDNGAKVSLETAMVASLTRESGRHLYAFLRYICSVPKAAAAAGILAEMKRDDKICVAYARSNTRQADSLQLSDVCASNCTALTEFEIEVVSASNANDNLSPEWQRDLLAYTVSALNDTSSAVKKLYPHVSPSVILIAASSVPTQAPAVPSTLIPDTLAPTLVTTPEPLDLYPVPMSSAAVVGRLVMLELPLMLLICFCAIG